jgi:type II secretion system protein H
MQRRGSSARSGFTLLELLLVALILAALAALVLPSLSSSNARSHLDATARGLVALARAARARATAEGRVYYIEIDQEKKEIRIQRARDYLATPNPDVAGDSEVEGYVSWIDTAPWAKPIPFEDGVNMVWAQVAGQGFQGTGGMPPAPQTATDSDTTTSSLFGVPQATTSGLTTGGSSGSLFGNQQQPSSTPSNSNAPVVAPTLAYPRISFDPDGSADDAFVDFEGAGDKIRVYVEAASSRTRVLTDDEYKAALAGTPPPLATEPSR